MTANADFEKGLLLFQQSRFDQAQTALRQALAADPDDAHAHALLALCLAERQQFADAEEEARQAIGLAPGFPFAHYALARVAADRNAYDEALTAIQEAVRLDPDDPDYRALLAAVHFDERRWSEALKAAEEGLRLDAEHPGCANLRAMALVKLGRRNEAGATIEAALAKDPQNAVTHANRGWALLEQRETERALEHFREALRLDPTSAWARQGIVEALKARNVIYAAMLRYFLWMSKLSPRAQWGVILGGYFGNRALGGLAASSPEMAPVILPLRILYVVFVLLTWTAQPLFNLVLRLDRFGRMALSPEEIFESNTIGGVMLLGLLSLGACLVVGFDSPFLFAALVFGFLIIPMAGAFKCPPGWPRTAMWIYTGVVAAAGLAVLIQEFTNQTPSALLVLFLLGVLGSSWVANVLITQRPRK